PLRGLAKSANLRLPYVPPGAIWHIGQPFRPATRTQDRQCFVEVSRGFRDVPVAAARDPDERTVRGHGIASRRKSATPHDDPPGSASLPTPRSRQLVLRDLFRRSGLSIGLLNSATCWLGWSGSRQQCVTVMFVTIGTMAAETHNQTVPVSMTRSMR